MNILKLRVYEHPSIPDHEAWLVRRADSSEVPPDLRETIHAPCILTGDAVLLSQHLTFLQLAEAVEACGITSL
jgi:hypothetical protein